MKNGKVDGRVYELCLFAELRDRLRAGDIWVTGSRHYRAVEGFFVLLCAPAGIE